MTKGIVNLLLLALLCGCLAFLVANNNQGRERSRRHLLDAPNTDITADAAGAADAAKRDITNDESPAGEHEGVAGLSCRDHGGPSDEIAEDMVYWRDIPSDSEYVSPYANYGPEVKYLTVEPDEGNWNNKRMAIESAIALAVATGRILVLPPKQDLVYDDIFNFGSVVEEHPSLKVITTEEFLTREALTGNLKDKDGKVVYPPENRRVNWDGDMRLWWTDNQLWPYLRSVTTHIKWDKDRCVAVIPDQPGPGNEARIQEYVHQIINVGRMHSLVRIEGYTNNPTPVDAPPLARLREMMGTRKEVCIYDVEMQNAKYLHAMGNNLSNARFFAHFYTLLFFEDWRLDLFVKRFIRDHFRYADDLQCAAARVVNEMRETARVNGQIGEGGETSNPKGEYDTFHVRRGDFLEFQEGSKVDALQIYKNTRSVLQEGGTIFIATDERDKKFFDSMREHYRIYFLDDFEHLLGGLPMHKFGMLDQVCIIDKHGLPV